MSDKLEALKMEALNEMLLKGYDPGDLTFDSDKPQRFGPKDVQWCYAHVYETGLNGEPFVVVAYGDWRGEKFRFQSKSVNLSPEDRAHLVEHIKVEEEKAAQARKQMQDEAALEYQAKWETLSASGTSPYLERKKISEPFGGRFQGDTIYIPCRNKAGEIRTLQQIQPDGQKFFQPGGQSKGCFHIIGDIEVAGTIYLGEGFATCASIHMATGKCTAVAFNADNLICVAQTLKEKYPGKEFVICGDDDRWTKKADGVTPTNPGREKAKKAAKQVEGKLIFPVFETLIPKKTTDFNDLHCLEGIEVVADQFANLEEKPKDAKEKPPSQATLLLELCESLELFHTSDEECYATVPVSNHKETWALRSQGFKRWLLREYYLKFGSAPCTQSVQEVIGSLGATAQFDGEERQVFLRIAQHDGKVYVDLTNKDWDAVEISAESWSLVKNPPIKFIRSKRMRPLPHPLRIRGDAGVAEFRRFLNVETDEEFKLIVAWIINAFSPSGPYLVLVLYGEQGTAKSTTSKIIRALIDPNEAPLRAEPKNVDDLMVSAKGNWVIATDNMSYLPDWLSDSYCRLATGGGLSKREHYSNDEEIVLNAKRPIILNGIDEFVARGDLASRTVTLQLQMISEGERKRENIFWAEFEEAQPKILGALFDGISTALKNEDQFESENKLRMADAWHWVSSAETAFGWERGSTVKAFRLNQVHANEIVLNSSAIYPFIRQLSVIGWSGTATVLLGKMNSMRGGAAEFDRSWPKNAKSLTDKIRRINPGLRLAGLEVNFSQSAGNDSERIVTIRKIVDSCDASDASTDQSSGCDEGDARNHDDSSGTAEGDFNFEQAP